ncbi:MAG: hypothetical protein BAJATHORv1_40043 [Candidatus Thorarchaeota archaeon]|nr:MAG: hypothetical protein BAJATHORv1_40043 [Candidatus Thorarchaeota archaeon]
MDSKDIPWKISSLGQLSVLMEVSSPKPGNVNRLRRFSDTGYRHFLASATLFSKGLYKAAQKGVELAGKEDNFSTLKIGKLIYESTHDILTGLNRRNTILGTILLHIPIAMAAGFVIAENNIFHIDSFQIAIKDLIDSTTVEDTIEVYRGFQLTAVNEQRSEDWSQLHHRYDISNPNVLDNIRQDHISLLDIFRISSTVDSISKEWSSYFSLTLNESLPYLRDNSSGLDDLEEAIVRTFIWLLARYPDGLIIKKAGEKKANEIMYFARDILAIYENSRSPITKLMELDALLREEGNILNPGSTADLISAAIFCRLLELQFG